MIRIDWDKENLEKQMKTWNGISILDYWIPLWVYVDNVEISGLKNVPGGDVTHIITFFPELLSVVQLFDPEKLKTAYPFNELGIQENRVTGGGFEFSLEFDKDLDVLTINYTNKGIGEWRTLKIQLKEYVDGALYASWEILDDIKKIAPEKYIGDDGVISLQTSYNTIRDWYEERYHEPVEENYLIHQRNL